MGEAGGAAGAKRPWLLLGSSISQARLGQLCRSLCFGTAGGPNVPWPNRAARDRRVAEAVRSLWLLLWTHAPMPPPWSVARCPHMARLTAVLPKVCRKPWRECSPIDARKRPVSSASPLLAAVCSICAAGVLPLCFFSPDGSLSRRSTCGTSGTGMRDECESKRGNRITGQDRKPAGGVTFAGWVVGGR